MFGNNGSQASTISTACWSGPQYPNGTVDPGCNSSTTCTPQCLYNLDEDEGEYVDVSAGHPAVLAMMSARLDALRTTIFHPNRSGNNLGVRELEHKQYYNIAVLYPKQKNKLIKKLSCNWPGCGFAILMYLL